MNENVKITLPDWFALQAFWFNPAVPYTNDFLQYLKEIFSVLYFPIYKYTKSRNRAPQTWAQRQEQNAR